MTDILEKWQYPVHDQFWDDDIRKAAKDGKDIGINEDGSYFVVGEQGSGEDDSNVDIPGYCYKCGGVEFYNMPPFKQCKDCGEIFEKS